MDTTKVRVIQQSLKYRLFSKKHGRKKTVDPKIGDIVALPNEVLKKELNSKNVRLLRKDEKMALKAKAEARKAKKKKAKKKKKEK